MAKKFRERNLTVIAIVGVVGMVLAIAGTFELANLPMIAGSSYSAAFTESGGLQEGDPVKVAGLQVGKVESVDLDGTVIKVDFTAKHVTLGQQTTAQIKTGTLLGARYLNVVPQGNGQLTAEIPVQRTTAPYSLTQGIDNLTHETQQLDTGLIAQALQTFSDTFRDTSGRLQPAFDGLTRLSQTISSRDQALRDLFAKAESVTGTFEQRTQQITALVNDGNVLLGELQSRRQVISNLISTTSALADQVSGFVNDNQAQLKPALDQLNGVLDLLRRNQGNIVAAVDRASAFITGLGEGVAHGMWFTGHLDLSTGIAATQGLVPPVPGATDAGATQKPPALPGLLGVNQGGSR